MSLIRGRVILAAAKLALFYVALVAVEIALLIVAFTGEVPRRGEIAQMSALLAIPFAFAFLLLAVARRWGFVALWGILGTLWVFLTLESGAWAWSITFPRLFLPWTIFALPLWIIGQAGIPSRSATRLGIGPLSVSVSMALLLCWTALLLGAQWLVPFETYRPYHPTRIANPLGWIWGVAPFVLSAYAMRHVWRGTANPVTA